MMHENEKSDPVVRALNSANKANGLAAESGEQRAGAKGKTAVSKAVRTQGREAASPGLERLRQRAKEHRDEPFTALLHHITVDLLTKSYYWLKRDAAAGVDGVTWRAYGENLQADLEDLHARVHRGAYRAQPSRRRMIPKADGRQRPLGIASLEDKIVQRAVVEVLSEIYEPGFLGFSYGFRPSRSQHDALDALWVGISRTPINYVLDADISRFFETVPHDELIGFLQRRVGDRRIIRLILKWLKVGVLEEGRLTATEMGTPQGAVISPLLSNIYLHYVLDIWAHQWRKRPQCGRMLIVRYADDVVCGFANEMDAQAFHAELRARFEEYALSLHPEKTRLIEFGRFAQEHRKRRGQGKPETFAFLGFTHICGKSRNGKFLLVRRSRRDRMILKLKEIKKQLRHDRHESIPDQGIRLKRVVAGWFNYHAVPCNSAALSMFRFHIMKLWQRELQRRSQRSKVAWTTMQRLATQWLPMPRIRHPWPSVRFAVKHPRWEPSA